MVALNHVQKLVKSMIGVIISEATLLKFILRLHQALETWEVTATEALLKQQTINVDETSLKVDKTKHWIHVYSSGDITLKFLHNAHNLFERFQKYEKDVLLFANHSHVSFTNVELNAI